MQFTCDDKQTLIAYLYGEIEPAARRRSTITWRTCARCAAEVDGAWRRAIGAGPVGAARCRSSISRSSRSPSCRRRTCCVRRAGGTRCRCGRRPPPRSSCSPPAPRSPTCRSVRSRWLLGQHRLDDSQPAPAPQRAVDSAAGERASGSRRWSRSNSSCATRSDRRANRRRAGRRARRRPTKRPMRRVAAVDRRSRAAPRSASSRRDSSSSPAT